MSDEGVLVVITPGEGGKWTRTHEGWIWEGPTRMRIKDKGGQVLGEPKYIESTVVLKNNTGGGPASVPEVDPFDLPWRRTSSPGPAGSST